MTTFFETSRALGEFSSNRQLNAGDHHTSVIQASVPGLLLGHESFDPKRHMPYQIDPLAPFADVVGEDQVRMVRPERPLHIQVVTDYTTSVEHPALTQAKRVLAEDLRQTIADSLTGMADRAHFYATGSSIPSDIDPDTEVLHAVEPSDIDKEIYDIAHDGLTFVISSFRQLRLNMSQAPDSLVAVKVNNFLDREIPPLGRRIVVEGLTEVNTKKPKELAQVNEWLQNRHQSIVEELAANGAAVASIVTLFERPAEYDQQVADNLIADAIRQLQD